MLLAIALPAMVDLSSPVCRMAISITLCSAGRQFAYYSSYNKWLEDKGFDQTTYFKKCYPRNWCWITHRGKGLSDASARNAGCWDYFSPR